MLNVSLVVGIWGMVLSSFSQPEVIVLPLQLGAGVTVLATLFQLYLKPNAERLYLAALAVEGCIGLLSWFAPWPYAVMAGGTLLAGFGAVALKHDRFQIAPHHWDIVPLAFAVVGWLLGHFDFQAYTGLYTLGGALIGVLVGRRRSALKGVTYLGIAAFSFGVYELLVYQLLQTKGGHPGDALVLFAGLATMMAIADRVLARWSPSLLKLTPNLTAPPRLVARRRYSEQSKRGTTGKDGSGSGAPQARISKPGRRRLS